MTSYKEQWIENGVNSRPHVSVTMNFTKPSAGKPALLTFSEVNTFLHEFGHALHGMFANTTYSTMSGTSVYWDLWSFHHKLWKISPQKRISQYIRQTLSNGRTHSCRTDPKIVDASNFNVAYACLRQVSFGLLDMAWYTRRETFDGDVRAYEKKHGKSASTARSRRHLHVRTVLTYYGGGYSAGYYSYKWAEVLDADAFSLFKEKESSTRKSLLLSGEYSLERRNGTSDDPLQTLPWTRTQYPCLAEKKWNHQLKTKQYETKVYSLYTNATPFLMELQQ